jgi:AbiV family abortive infection protein
MESLFQEFKGMQQAIKEHFRTLYEAAHTNALELLSEAEILFEKDKYARAYALAFTALEEISKSQLAADVVTGFIEEEEFWTHYRNHKKKIDGMAWASEDAKHYLDYDERGVEVHEPRITRRMNALYVSSDRTTVQSPKDAIGKEQSKSIIHTVRVAFDQIAVTTNTMAARSDRRASSSPKSPNFGQPQ